MAELERPLTEQELKELQQNLARLSEDSVRREYDQAWEECRMRGERLPPAKAVQRLVQAWKQLWKWRQ
jgi:lysozyme family protein